MFSIVELSQAVVWRGTLVLILIYDRVAIVKLVSENDSNASFFSRFGGVACNKVMEILMNKSVFGYSGLRCSDLAT
ncbi:hypothetical protein LR48_Vigan06g062100 [Vigna angularis]|uniref:Uncharacterized protein n=1 Tax=Phaseolus angularis TaxID=3914 RepID=A0A0L9UQZ1_PHAAN|nr:hypothetical protein LR48_Vigan06g062100 [Vigna angularis]